MKPNIILFMTDQQRWDSLGCYGNECVNTKNADRLIEEAIAFQSAYSTCPACVPARGCLLTGLNQYNLGSVTYGASLKAEYPVTLPKLLKEQGYNTVAVGKNHFNPQRAMHGYDRVFLDESNRIESKDFMSDYMQWFQSQTGHTKIIPDNMDFNGFNGAPYIYDEALHPTSWTKNKAKEEIERLCNDTKPWFLKISFARPHSPYDAPKRWFDYYYNRNDLPMPQDGDHGDMLGDRNLWRKTYAYEGSAHIPLIIKPPKNLKTQSDIKYTPCTLYDILPTVMGVLNSPKTFYTDGIDLFQEKRKYLHGEYIYGYERKMDMQFVCDGRHKLIWYMRTGKTEFYDLKSDPYEKQNLSKNPRYASVIKELTDYLIQVMSERGINILKKSGKGLKKYRFKLPYGKYGADGRGEKKK